MPPDLRSLEALSAHECLDLLRGAQVGRVVFTADALPAIVPVTFAVDREAVVLRTAADTRLAAAAGAVVAFEADDLDPVSRTGWSVVVTATAQRVTDHLEQARISGLVSPWAPGQLEVFIRIPLTLVTGRRITSAGG